MIAIYTKANRLSEPVLRFEHATTLDDAVSKVMKRFPVYIGEEHAQDTPARSVGWFQRADGRCLGVGYDVLPEPGSSLQP